MISFYVTVTFSVIFLLILALLHFLKPEFDPKWRMISEYEIGRFGWMMRIAFFCWGISVLALLIEIWPVINAYGVNIGGIWLIVIISALFGAGIFKTNPITENSPNIINTIHTLCGALVILTFPIAATIIANNLLNSEPLGNTNFIIFATILVWLGMISFFVSIIISRKKDPSMGRVGPKVYLGWPNRFLVFTYIIWNITISIYVN